jgi:hypothetical protein
MPQGSVLLVPLFVDALKKCVINFAVRDKLIQYLNPYKNDLSYET